MNVGVSRLVKVPGDTNGIKRGVFQAGAGLGQDSHPRLDTLLVKILKLQAFDRQLYIYRTRRLI